MDDSQKAPGESRKALDLFHYNYKQKKKKNLNVFPFNASNPMKC